jgi:hypothetical protein
MPVATRSPAGGIDVSKPTVVIGDGKVGSCKEEALRIAIAAGGVITFDCGADKTVIAITQPLIAPNDKDTVIDGGDRIVLDGQGSAQILRAFHPNFRFNDRYLAVQRLTMVNGRDVGTGFAPRNGNNTCAWGYKDGGGGAIFTRDVNVKIWGVTFENNHGPDIGPDVAGGAIYMMGAKSLTIAHSVFRNNTAANGGAVGVLHVATFISDSVFEGNKATGQLANFANALTASGARCPTFNHEGQGGAGGLGGAFYSDGFDEGDTFARVRMANNTSNDLGGGVFRSAYWGLLNFVTQQTIRWSEVTLEGNRAAKGGGGGAYLNNSLLVLRNVSLLGNTAEEADGGGLKLTGITVDAADTTFLNNKSVWGGGVAQWGDGPAGANIAVRNTFGSNAPQDAVGVYPK